MLFRSVSQSRYGQIKGVYFPLARFGRYIVVMRNQNGEVESDAGAKADSIVREWSKLNKKIDPKNPKSIKAFYIDICTSI